MKLIFATIATAVFLIAIGHLGPVTAQDQFMRFGRQPDDMVMRFGRGGMDDAYMRFGRAGMDDAYMRFGRGEAAPFLRFGKKFDVDLKRLGWK